MYTPVAQRNTTTYGGYVPVALRKKKPQVKVVQAQPKQTISGVVFANPRQTISGVTRAQPNQVIVPAKQTQQPKITPPTYRPVASRSPLFNLSQPTTALSSPSGIDINGPEITPLSIPPFLFRGAGNTAITVARGEEKLREKIFGIKESDYRVPNQLENKWLYGSEPIKGFTGEGEDLFKSLGAEKLSKNKSASFVLGGVVSLLDFTGAGGEKNAIKALAAASKVDDVVKILKKINVAEDIITDYAPIIAKTTDEAEVIKLVDRISELQKTTKVTPKIASELDPLALEARKYKSAEEFVKAQRKMYRGTALPQKGDLDVADTYGLAYGKGAYLASDESFARSYGDNVSELYPILKKPWIMDKEVPSDVIAQIKKDFPSYSEKYGTTGEDLHSFFGNQNEANEYLQKLGYDGLLDAASPGSKQTIVFDSKNVLTKSQLTDIWKKANEAVKTVKAKPVPLATKIENAYTNLAKLGYEKESIGAKFESSVLEGQYQTFKKTVPIKKLDEIEDAAQFKVKVKADPKEIDNMLYSQELTDSEVFDMFKERRFKELNERGLKGEIKQQETLVKKDLNRLEKTAKIRAEKQQAVDRIKTAYEKKIEKINTAKDILDNRRSFIKATQKQFGLSDNDLKTITRRDIRLMSNVEFKKHLDNILIKSEQLAEKKQLINEVQGNIQRLELQKVDNLQEALKFPTIPKMSPEQLGKFNETLNQFKQGDEFLSVRKLQTVDNTDLKGIKTIREAKERLAKELNTDVAKLDNIKVEPLDRFRYDTALAEKNPFYGLMVDTVNKSMLNAEARFLQTESKINTLINAARKSRKQGIIDKFVPQDKEIFKWLESPDEVKKTLNLTNEELEAAQYIQKQYADMRDYLVQFGTLKKYRQDYITHINRGFLEEWKETNLLSAMKNVFKQYQNEEAIFNIIDDTGKILPLEKFFQFSMRRTGKIAPTQNVANAFLSYLKAFEKKSALDSVVPKLDIYAHSLTPKILTPRGLEFDRSLKTFVNEWLNTKKGRTAKIVGIEQGGKIDLLLRAGKAFTSTLDLGLNIPVGIAARAGENMTNFVNLGTKKYALGLIRARTQQGKKIASAYKNFIGRTPFSELSDASKGLGDKLFNSAFGLFKDATTRANKTFLLGSLSDQEFKTGLLSAERLAFLKSEMGRYRVVEGAKSVVGSTSLGNVLTQYKSWAIPPIRTTIDNISKLIKNPSLIKQREGQELLRATMATLGVVFAYKAFAGDEEDKSFLGTITNKIYRDSMTLVGALDPKTITSEPRLVSFMADLGESLSQIVKLEGFKQAQRTLTPRLIKQFIPSKEKSEPKNKGGLPKLPKLPKTKF